MTRIDSIKFGSIEIDGEVFKDDVYITPSKGAGKGDIGHDIGKKIVEKVLKEDPEVLLIGKGFSNAAGLTKKAQSFSEEKNVEIVKDSSDRIKERFNKLTGKKKVGAIIHLTC